MNHSRRIIEEESIPLLITSTAFQIAQQFANQQPTLEKKEQVYFNTLAVCVVNEYMKMMDIPTNLMTSDSWNAAMRLYGDVADLTLAQLGHLECRAMHSSGICYIPPEVPEDRIGVVVVEIDTEHKEAVLLGFAQTVRAGELPLEKLQPIDTLLEHIDNLETRKNEVKLSQWLQNIFDANWLSVSEILVPKEPALAFRYKGKATRAKLIEFGTQSSAQAVVLVVTLVPATSGEIQIKMQVYPTTEQASLPENLVVKVLNEKATTIMSARTAPTNAQVTLELGAQLEERFSVRLELGDTNVTENFLV